MNVLICVESLIDSGAEIFPIRFANEIAPDHSVTFFEMHPAKSTEKRQLALIDQEKIRIVYGIDESSKNFLVAVVLRFSFLNKYHRKVFQTLRLLQVAWYLKKNNIPLVHSHSLESDVFFGRLRRFCNFKFISSFHGHYEYYVHKQSNFRERASLALAAIDRVIFSTKAHVQTLDAFSYPQEKRVKIFYGYSVAKAERVTSYHCGETLRLVVVARGVYDKGWEETIKAFLRITAEGTYSLSLTLVGSGEFLDVMKERYSHPQIHFTGYQDDVRPYIAASHVCLLPSYLVSESLPNSVIEYLASGKPVVSTYIGAIDEMITHEGEIAGALLKLKNGVVDDKDIEVAVRRYLEHPELVAQHSALALKAFSKFEMKNCVDRHLSLYEQVLAE